MLYFSKTKLFIIYFIIIFLSVFSFANFISNKDNIILSKKINLGLGLQGGSYLLLEVDSRPIINQNLQQKVLSLRKFLKKNKIKYQNLKLLNQTINFQLKKNDIEKFENFFLDKENTINTFYGKYKDYEMVHFIENNNVEIKYSTYVLIELKLNSLDQSLEIVIRRIDEVGTN